MAFTKAGSLGYGDVFGGGNQTKMSELRTYYNLSGTVSLNGDMNGGAGGAVPTANPAAGAQTSLNSLRSNGRTVTKIGVSELITSGTSWTPRETYSNVAEYSIHLTGAGASGGGSSTSQGREGGACGGGESDGRTSREQCDRRRAGKQFRLEGDRGK